VTSQVLHDTVLQKYYNEIVPLIASHEAMKLCNFMIFLGWCLQIKG